MTQVKLKEVYKLTYSSTPLKRLATDEHVIWTRPSRFWGLKFTAIGDSKLRFSRYTPADKFQVSLDDSLTWQDYASGTTLEVPSGQTVCFRLNGQATGKTGHFSIPSGQFAASGSIMSLIDGTRPTDEIIIEEQFGRLFDGTTGLVQAPDLTAVSVPAYAYGRMFAECTDLIRTPEISARYLGKQACSNMFESCTNLKYATPLHTEAVGDACCFEMFLNCTSLVQAPVLPCLYMTEHCYAHMFEGCTSLVEPPDLPSKAFQDGCYASMFLSCTSLRRTPLFDCELFSTVRHSAFENMFSHCTSLSEARVTATTWSDSNTQGWLDDTAPHGTFYKPAALKTYAAGTPKVEGYIQLGSGSGIPAGWTVINT